jgi:hypothetical protein
MKKEKQIGIRVGVPAFFALELEDVYKHTEGAHRALAFSDFVGLLVGMGLEQYRKGNAAAPDAGEDEDQDGLHDLFTEFNKTTEIPGVIPDFSLGHMEE